MILNLLRRCRLICILYSKVQIKSVHSLREWTGYAEDKEFDQIDYMHHYIFQTSPSGGSTFCATGQHFDGDTFSVSGTFFIKSDKVHVHFDKRYTQIPEFTLRYTGTFNRETRELSGSIMRIINSESDDTSVLPLETDRFFLLPVSPLFCQSVICPRPSIYPLSETNTFFDIISQRLRDAHTLDESGVDRLENLLDPDITRRRVIAAFMMRELYSNDENSSYAGSLLIQKVLPENLRNYYFEWDKKRDKIKEEAPHHESDTIHL